MKKPILMLSLMATAIGIGIAGAQDSDMSFFLTSEGPGDGANLGGLEGADAHCQMLADSVGAGGKTWRAYHNRFWPTLYLIDKRGRIRYQHIGEGRYAETEAAIQALLEE